MTTYIIYKTKAFVKNFMKFLVIFLIFEENSLILGANGGSFRSLFPNVTKFDALHTLFVEGNRPHRPARASDLCMKGI